MNEEQESLFFKAEETLTAARILAKSGLNRRAVSEIYYSMFYVAQAALLDKDIFRRSHSGVIAGFGREFAKSRILDRKFHGWLVDMEKRRLNADYGPPVDIPNKDVEISIANAEEFLGGVRAYLEKS